ncbi:type 1 glutamine amidotransferase domain-containing protein [Clostridium sp. LY3-2]|uniref:type 1 glutamine amidotransferase domain-containing protein n=1 Tax=Clostridium sp. LY3-2 TaxID=2942482 RepID=UPI002153537E|nr:type 1 glutamine amidotransferase domain-containing protein [Clostridium sp. LY3-2]MCR6514417.1 type 1 glutamine amidotransferase domain-containing protein [Clostridium sp. LY3-2]
MKKVLVVVTNVSKYENADVPTGLWLGEAVHFVDVMEKAGYTIDYVSPKGGYTPIDPHSLEKDFMGPVDWKYYTDMSFMNKLGNTLSADSINPDDYEVIYYTGGHGVIWDFPNDTNLQGISRKIYENGGIVSAVCHGLGGLLNIKLSNGKNLIDGIKLTGFSNSEEKAVGLDKLVPYLTETELKNRGASYVKGADWSEFSVSDNRVITGQNPASGAAVAREVLKVLK